MKAVRFHEYGSCDVLQVEDVPDPLPGPHDVVVRVFACGVNHIDIDVRSGNPLIVERWGPPSLPHQLGGEVAGEVAVVGKDVKEFVVGDRVWVIREIPCLDCEYCLAGMDNLCLDSRLYGLGMPGGYAEYVVAPARAVFALPDCVSYETAAAGQISFTTAWHMLINRAELKAGETVLISSAGSGVGHAAIQIARLAGATVLTTIGADHKLEWARQYGADHVINYRTEDVTERALELTGGRGVDLVLEHVGGELFGSCLRALRKRGRLITCGGHGGEVVEFAIVPFYDMEWTVHGSRTATVSERQFVIDLFAAERLRPHIHAVLPLSQAAEAHRIIESREQFGKLVLQP